MKVIAFFIGVIVMFSYVPKLKHVESKVYSFSKAHVMKTDFGDKRELINGETTHLANFEIQTITLKPGKGYQGSQVYPDYEKIIFVKEGLLKIKVNEESKEAQQGSLALIMPRDEHEVENTGKSTATFYTIKYKSKQPINMERGENAGGSVLLDWDNIQFTVHEKGGIRKCFDRKSAMSERIEIHATTLNPAIKSHEPHTHLPAEIVIMMEGTTEMEIGDGIYAGNVGDVYFLGSNIPHAIRNTGSKPCMYLAFQWE